MKAKEKAKYEYTLVIVEGIIGVIFVLIVIFVVKSL